MVVLSQEECAACESVFSDLLRDPRVIRKLDSGFVAFKADRDEDEGRLLIDRYRLDATPAFLFLHAGGREIDRLIGLPTPGQFLNALYDVENDTNTLDYTLRRLANDPLDPTIQLAALEGFVKRNDLLSVLAYEKMIRESNPEFYAENMNRIMFTVERTYFVLRDYTGAIAHSRQYIEEYPSCDVNARYRFIARCFDQLGRYGEAAEAYATAIELFPSRIDNYIGYVASSYLAETGYADALAKASDGYRLADAQPQQQAELLFFVYLLQDRLGNQGAATDALSRAIALDPDPFYLEYQEQRGAPAQAEPTLAGVGFRISPSEWHFASIRAGEEAEIDLVVNSTGDKPLAVSFITTCSCLSVFPERIGVREGEPATISLRYETDRVGPVELRLIAKIDGIVERFYYRVYGTVDASPGVESEGAGRGNTAGGLIERIRNRIYR
jgi:tetratricopeptide (TPR) repeat protein